MALTPSGREFTTRAKSFPVRLQPYRHIVIDDMLDASSIANMRSYIDHLRLNSAHIAAGERDYGAQIFAVDQSNINIFSSIINKRFIAEVSGHFEIPVTNYIDAAVHVHPEGSPSGWLHTDFNTGWFSRANGDSLSFSAKVPCDYRTGSVRDSNTIPCELVRAIAILVYFSDNWDQSDAGETVLARGEVDGVEGAQERIAPLYNRLLAFECSPISFHSFRRTNRERFSLIFWLHSTKEEVSKRWPLHLRSGWK